MKILRYLRRPLHRDPGGEKGVRAAHPRRLGAIRGSFEMRHLRARMNARVGATGAGQGDPLAPDFRERALELVLDGVAGRLRLPSFQTRPAVAHSNGEFHFFAFPKTAIGARGADCMPRIPVEISRALGASFAPAAAEPCRLP